MKKILIIEDEVNLGDTLVQKLRASGFDVILERDGLAGFNAIKAVRPDLILTDINLNSLNGFEILTKKQLDPSISNIPIIVLSNSVMPFSVGQLKNYDASDFIDKSKVTPTDILSKINDFFTSHENKKTDLTGKRILIVEDDAFLQSIVAMRMRSSGAEVVTVSTGEAALDEIQKQPLDLILLDILLPGMSGFDVLTKLQADEKNKHIPVIITSNFNQHQDKEKANSFGAKFLVKAMVTPNQIVSAVGEVLG